MNFAKILSIISAVKSIVNVSSIAGMRAYPGALAYKMSKAAMDQLTRCSALDLIRKYGIRVNSVNPGKHDRMKLILMFARFNFLPAKPCPGTLRKCDSMAIFFHPIIKPSQPQA